MKGLEMFLQTFDEAQPLLLDLYPADAAYSLRKLRTDYTGAAVKVRRSIDDSEQDIGFVNNILDTASLLTFVGAGDGFVSVWYDQSLNLSDLSNTTKLRQPQIVSSGSVVANDGKPTIKYLKGASMSSLRGDLNLTGNDGMLSLVFKAETTENEGCLFGHSSSGGVFLGIIQDGSTSTGVVTGLGSPTFYKNNVQIISPNRDLLHTNYNTGLTVLSIVDNLNWSSNSIWNTNGSQPFVYASGSNFTWELLANECIVWQTDQSANRILIQNNINEYYNIY